MTIEVISRYKLNQLTTEAVQRASGSVSTSTPSNNHRRPTQISGPDPENKRQYTSSILDPIYRSSKYYFRIRFYDYQKPIPSYGLAEANTGQGKVSNQVKYEIKLPLPISLYDQANITYDSASLGLLGDMSSFFQGFGPAAAGGVEELQKFLIDQASEVGPAAVNRIFYEVAPNLLNSAVGGIPGLGNIAASLQQSIGATTNPNEALVLQGPPLRTWNFRWLILPHNEEESTNVHNLVRELKARSLPFIAKSTVDSGVTGLLGYPQICRINTYPWDGGDFSSSGDTTEWTENSIMKIKRTMLAGVNVNYNSQGSPAFFRGTNNPVSIELALAFKEIEYFLAEDEAALHYDIPLVENPFDQTQNAVKKYFGNNNTVSGQ